MEATCPEGTPHVVARTTPRGLHFFVVLRCCIDSLRFYGTLFLYAEMWYIDEMMVLPGLTLTDHRKCVVAYAFWKYVLFEFWNLTLILLPDWRLEVQGHKETIHSWIGPRLPLQIIFQRSDNYLVVARFVVFFFVHYSKYLLLQNALNWVKRLVDEWPGWIDEWS